MEVTLSQLLESRDNRQAKQRKLIDTYQKAVISLTVVMPGAEKKSEVSEFIARQAVEAVHERFGTDIITSSEYDLPTGYEAFFVVDRGILEVKEMVCEIEDGHSLGRLFDLDVISSEGIPVPREQVGRSPRKCLVCDDEARNCMRNRNHDLEEVQSMINGIVTKYRNGCSKILK